MWYQPDDADVGVKSSFKSKAAKAAAAASGALLIRQALREWERFKVMQRAAGKPEDPLPAEATGNRRSTASYRFRRPRFRRSKTPRTARTTCGSPGWCANRPKQATERRRSSSSHATSRARRRARK